MNSVPFFSILVPTYNQAQYLGEALESLISQTDPDWEAIIVNDGSTDSTSEVLEYYQKKEARFIVIHKENGGVGSALNLALRNSQGQWICWLSSDDLFEPYKLKLHREWIYRYPNFKFFFSDFRQLLGTTGKIVNLHSTLNKEIPPIKLQVIEMLRRNFVAGNSICIHKDSWLSTGFFNESLRYAQDYDMWLRLMIDYPALFIPEYTYLQRIYSEQESQRYSNFCLYDSCNSSIQILNKYDIEELFHDLKDINVTDLENTIDLLMSVAFDSTSFIYRLGFHPLMIFKTYKFINKYGKVNDRSLLFKKLSFCSKEFTYSPQGFWSSFAKRLISDNSTSILENLFLLQFEKLGENYYWWLKYIESDLYISVEKYFNNILGYSIPPGNTNNEDIIYSYKLTLQDLIRFVSDDTEKKYFKLLFNLYKQEVLPQNFFEKIVFLEKLDISLEFILNKIRHHYGQYKGFTLILIIYFIRTYRLIRQGYFFTRFRGYIGYIVYSQQVLQK